MKRLTTLKGWLFMAAAFIAGITACSKVDNGIEDPSKTEMPKIYTMTVTASKVDTATTRAFSLDGKKLTAIWTKGEVVQVYSVRGEDPFEEESLDPVGTLTAQSSGATTTLKGEFLPAYNPFVGAKLRLKFNDLHDYTTQGGTLEYIAANCDYALADIIVSTVDDETGNVTSTDPAIFVHQQAIVKFSLKQPDGTTPVVALSLTVNVASATYSVTLANPASDIYVAIQQASNKSVSLSANTSTGNFSYDKTGITFKKGKYYDIGVKMNRIPTLGDLYYSDGTYSWLLEEGKTPIGVVAYVGTDAFTEDGVTLRDGTTTLQSHGLVLCLKNTSDSAYWRDLEVANVIDFSSDAIVNSTSALKRSTNVSGYANTKILAEKDNATLYPAAYQAWNYSALTAPDGTTGWFLPSAQQWVKILTGLGGLSESDIVWKDVKDSGLTSIHNLESAMQKAGEVGTTYDPMSSVNQAFWSSSESNAATSPAIIILPNYSTPGLLITYISKFDNHIDDIPYKARPVLAF